MCKLYSFLFSPLLLHTCMSLFLHTWSLFLFFPSRQEKISLLLLVPSSIHLLQLSKNAYPLLSLFFPKRVVRYTKLSPIRYFRKGSIVCNLTLLFTKDYFYDSNLWPLSHTTIILQLHQGSPSIIFSQKIKNTTVLPLPCCPPSQKHMANFLTSNSKVREFPTEAPSFIYLQSHTYSHLFYFTYLNYH